MNERICKNEYNGICFKKWCYNKLLPVLISVLATGLTTIFITNWIDAGKENEQLHYYSNMSAQQLADLKYKVEIWDKSSSPAKINTAICLPLIEDSSNNIDRLKLSKILSSKDVSVVISLFNQSKALDDLMKLYTQAKLAGNNEIAESAINQFNIEMRNEKYRNNIAKIDEIIEKIKNYNSK